MPIDEGVAISVNEESELLGERSEQRLESGPPAIIVDIDGTLILNVKLTSAFLLPGQFR